MLAVGRPLPGNRTDCTTSAAAGVHQATGAATVTADGGYRGTGLLIAHRRQLGQAALPAGQEEHHACHRRVRARVEHVLAQRKAWKILRDGRRRAAGVHLAARGIASTTSLGPADHRASTAHPVLAHQPRVTRQRLGAPPWPSPPDPQPRTR